MQETEGGAVRFLRSKKKFPFSVHSVVLIVPVKALPCRSSVSEIG